MSELPLASGGDETHRYYAYAYDGSLFMGTYHQ